MLAFALLMTLNKGRTVRMSGLCCFKSVCKISLAICSIRMITNSLIQYDLYTMKKHLVYFTFGWSLCIWIKRVYIIWNAKNINYDFDKWNQLNLLLLCTTRTQWSFYCAISNILSTKLLLTLTMILTSIEISRCASQMLLISLTLHPHIFYLSRNCCLCLPPKSISNCGRIRF